jgi:hypothetical protein
MHSLDGDLCKNWAAMVAPWLKLLKSHFFGVWMLAFVI